MPEASLSDRSHKGSSDKASGRHLFSGFRAPRITISWVTRPLAVAAGLIRARKFRRDVLRQMRLTVGNLHPEVILGGMDRRGWYVEIYLNFAAFRLRITRATYNSRNPDLWADLGSMSDPGVFFRMDYVITALEKLNKPGEVPERAQVPNTLAALDATIWAVHQKLAEHFSESRYSETKRMIQLVMHEDAALVRAE